jgi:single-stranded-DNA-specific exonuclease
MSVGIRCLLANTSASALPLATELDRYNRERREIEADMQDDAMAAIDAATQAGDAYSLCLYDARWHQGVVGIVASRLKDRFHRPAIVFARGTAGELKGSGRSIPGFHLRDALDLIAKRAPGLIARFGGHAFAAGLSLAEADLPRFRIEFEQLAHELLTPAQLSRFIETDGALQDDELTLDLATALRDNVWGQGFAAPVFDGEFAVAEQRIVGSKHLRLTLLRAESPGSARLAAILFNQTEPLPAKIRAAYRPDANEWNGSVSLQLVIEHWQALP